MSIEDYLNRYLVGSHLNKKRLEPLPLYLSDLLSTMELKERGGLAFFIDKRPITLPLLAFFYSLHKFSLRLPLLINKFSSLNVQPGDRIKVLPEGWVYEFRGLHPKYPDQFFVVSMTNESSSTRTIPISEFLRFEKTEREKPRGTLRGAFTDLEPLLIDFFLPGQSTFGNEDILETQCLILGKKLQTHNGFKAFGSRSKSSFNEYADFPHEFHSFGSTLPLGSINENGEISSKNNLSEPLIASSHSVENLFNSIRENKLKDRLILIDGTEKIDIDPYHLDHALSNNLVCVLASRDELFSSHSLKEKFEIVIPQEEEILRDSSRFGLSRKSPIGESLYMASNRKNLKIFFKFSQWKDLEDIYKNFYEILIESRKEHNEHLDKIMLTLFGLMFDLGECFKTDESLNIKLSMVERRIPQLDSSYIKIANKIKALVDSLHAIFKSIDRNDTPKYTDLCKILEEDKNQRTLILVRSYATSKYLESFIQDHVVVKTYNSFDLLKNENYEKILCLGWPNSMRFGKFWHRHLSDNIHFLGYGFENMRFRRFFSQYDGLHSRIIKDVSDPEWFAQGSFKLINKIQSYDDPNQPNDLDKDYLHDEASKNSSQHRELENLMQRIESRLQSNITHLHEHEEDVMLDARLITFAGGEGHSWFTEGHKVYVLDDLILRDKNVIHKRSVEELEEGNLVLFRDHGDKDFLRMIAKEELGDREYEVNLSRSREWKEALKSLGKETKEINLALNKLGLIKNESTVSQWLHNEDLIGPRDAKKDIGLIMSSVGGGGGYSRAEDIVKSVEIIRRSHLSAGFKLTEYLIEELKTNPPNLDLNINQVDLTMGKVFIAEIELIDEESREIGISSINRLIYSEDYI